MPRGTSTATGPVWGLETNSTTSASASWLYWVQTANACTNSGTITAAYEWPSNASSTTGTGTAQGAVWQIWAGQTIEHAHTQHSMNALSAALAQRASGVNQLQARGRVSPEELARQAAIRAEYETRIAVETAARKLAEAKAEILLRQLLTPEQKEDLEKKNCFYLHTAGKRFRIDRGRTGNVKLVDDKNEVVESYCIHPNIACPDADTMLAQKLLLETDLEKFERVANITARNARGRNRAGHGLTGTA